MRLTATRNDVPNFSTSSEVNIVRPNAISGISAINGTNYLCSGSSNYSLSNVPPGVSVNWSVSGSSISIPGSSTGSSVNATFSYSGTSTINANISDATCGVSTSRSLGIQAGVYSTSQFSITGPTETCPDPYNNEVYIYMNNSPTIVDGYDWTYSSAWNYGYSPSGNDYRLVPPGPGFGSAWVKLSIQNSCGWSVPYQWDVYESSGCSGHRGFMIGPNPAKDVLTLTFEEPLKPEEMLEKIELYSEKTTRLAKTVSENEKAQSDGNTLSIAVGDLPRGIYFLHVTDSHFDGEKTKRFRISLQ